VLALGVVVATGVVHGFWTDRWGLDEKIQRAVASLDKIPLKVGDWDGEEQSVKGRDIEDLPGHRYLRYVNRKTGDSISVVLVCGRAVKVSIHTPDVCYGASGFIVGKRIECNVKGGEVSGSPRFFSADMARPNAASGQGKQRLFWSWRTAGSWQVADNPRWAFVKEPVAFKLYLARELSGDVPVSDDEPCVRFLQLLLPELEKVLDDGAV
jgi:hypothetical protein